MSKRPKTSEDIEAAAERWLANLAGWKRQYVEGLRHQVEDLRERLAKANADLRDEERIVPTGETVFVVHTAESSEGIQIVGAYTDRDVAEKVIPNVHRLGGPWRKKPDGRWWSGCDYLEIVELPLLSRKGEPPK